MSDQYAVKRKAKDKAFYIKSAKQARNAQNELGAGMKGFLCTSNREKESVREAYNILNEFGDILYGPRLSEKNKAESANLDIEDELSKEVAELKKPTKPAERRFQSVATGVKGCLFIRTTVENPVDLVNAVMENIEKNHEQKTRFLMRLLPIQATCKPTAEEILKTAQSLVEDHMEKYNSFSILFKVRNYKLNRDEVIHPLAEIVSKKYPEIKVDLDHAEVSIVVEVLRKTCCIGIVPNYYGRAKYNLLELSQKKVLPEKEESASNEETLTKDESPEKESAPVVD